MSDENACSKRPFIPCPAAHTSTNQCFREVRLAQTSPAHAALGAALRYPSQQRGRGQSRLAGGNLAVRHIHHRTAFEISVARRLEGGLVVCIAAHRIVARLVVHGRPHRAHSAAQSRVTTRIKGSGCTKQAGHATTRGRRAQPQTVCATPRGRAQPQTVCADGTQRKHRARPRRSLSLRPHLETGTSACPRSPTTCLLRAGATKVPCVECADPNLSTGRGRSSVRRSPRAHAR
jgi:hypothetical protein